MSPGPGTLLILALALAATMSAGPAAGGEWEALEPGLELGDFALPAPSTSGDSRVTVLRIDPAAFDLRLLNASAPGQGHPHSARAWCERAGLVAAINASMYQEDLETSVSLMRTAGHANNSHLTRDRAVLAFDRTDESVPAADIIDLTCQNFTILREKYRSFVQSIRMVSCDGRNMWQQQPRRFSTAAIAVDKSGRVLFIHCRSPHTTHDFIDGLLALPLDIGKAMYVEGGPQAQLYVRAGRREIERVGLFENPILENDEDQGGWPIPNVVGIARKAR
jgi:uncharacterized protein YigE (DUF2233 family)